jgi:transposase-like protein
MSRYSNDLRLKVITFFKQNNSNKKPTYSKSEVCKTFGISRPTLNFWLKIEEKGNLFEVKKYHRGSISSVNLEELKKYIDENPDQYYHEIAKKFAKSKSQIHKIATQKLNYTSKKNRLSIVKPIKKLKPNLDLK